MTDDKRDLSAVYDPNHSDVVAARERDGWTRPPPNSVGMRSNEAGLWEFYRTDSNGDVTYRLPMTEEQMREARAGRPVDVPAELRLTSDKRVRADLGSGRTAEIAGTAGGRPVYTNAVKAREREESRRVDDDYLSELQRVWAAATPGPWHEHAGSGETTSIRDSSDECVIGDCHYYVAPTDIAAIAKAPEHVAALLAEVQRLRAENARLREALEGVSTTMTSWWTGDAPGRGAFYATCDVADGGPMLLAVREALKR
jgi:hypothetical protein